MTQLSYIVELPESRDWLSAVTSQLDGYPESVPGPAGAPVAVSYVSPEYVTLRGFADTGGRCLPLDFEVAPGVVVALDNVRFYVNAA